MKFGIKSLFVATLLAACLAYAYQAGLLLAVLAVIAINLLGIMAGLIVTKLLRFPTDGGYRDPIIRAEFGQDVSHTGATKIDETSAGIRNRDSSS